MRLDKYLKVSRELIKHRTVAKEVADKRAESRLNGILAKSSTDLKVNDQVEIRLK